MATLPLQTKLSVTTSFQATPRHRLVEFGDGYIQRTPLGLNSHRRSITVTHDNLDSTDAETLIDFYEDRLQDADKIDISSNGLLRTSGKFYLESYDVQMADTSKRTISANMIEVFDL